MKKLLLITIILIGSVSMLHAQQMNRQRMQMLKASFLTDALDLTPAEAEKFWPVYNKYNNEIQKSRNELEKGLMMRYNTKNNFNDLSEEQALQFLNESNSLEAAIYKNRTNMLDELIGVISAKKTVKLLKAEKDFNRRILQEFGRRGRIKRNMP